jgi:hypothetical protein
MSTITATVQLRRDTAANWTSNNPTLLAGEIGIESDTKRMKIGNGTQAWTALAYAQGTAALVNTGTGSTDVPTITDADARYRLATDGWNILTKPTATARTNNTLSADPYLVLPMAANTNYSGTITIYASASVAGDFKSRITGPASPTRVFLAQVFFNSAGSPSNRVANAYDTTDLAQTATSAFIIRGLINFTVENGANAGNFEFQWAQNSTDASATTLLAGSTIEWLTF